MGAKTGPLLGSVDTGVIFIDPQSELVSHSLVDDHRVGQCVASVNLSSQSVAPVVDSYGYW